MSVKVFLKAGVSVVNFGMEAFYNDLKSQGIPVVQVDWKPPIASEELLAKIRRLRGEA